MVEEKETSGNTVEAVKTGTEEEIVKSTKRKHSAKSTKAAVASVIIGPEANATVKAEAQLAGKMTESQLQKEFKKRAGIIKKQINNIQQSFLVIAFQLYWIKDHEMYAPLGYKNIYEFAEMEYGIGRSSCCNFICIIDNFAERDALGNVVESISECYRNFTSSQLIAMIGMSEEGKKRITPDMSVRLINRIRKQEAQARIGTVRDFGSNAEENEKPVAAAAVASEVETRPNASEKDELPSVPVVSAKENTASSGSKENGKKSMETTAVPAERVAESSGRKRTEPKIVVNTLLAFNSYGTYQKELEHIHALVEGAFKQSQEPVTIKIICEQEIA